MRIVIPLLIIAALALQYSHAEVKFTPHQVVEPFKAIVNAPHVNADDATKFVTDGELVLGVTVGNASRAYPINMLTNPTREIINDTLGGNKIAATW